MIVKLDDIVDVDVLWNNISKSEIILVLEDCNHNNNEVYLSRELATKLMNELKKRLL